MTTARQRMYMAIAFVAIWIAGFTLTGCTTVQQIMPTLRAMADSTDMYAAGYKKDDSVCVEFIVMEKRSGARLRAANCWYLWDVFGRDVVVISVLDSTKIDVAGDSTGNE